MSTAQRYLTPAERRETAEYVRSRMMDGFVPVEEQKEIARSVAAAWTKKERAKGFTPVLEDFLNQYPEWDHEDLYDTIEAEINRVSAMSRKEDQVHANR